MLAKWQDFVEEGFISDFELFIIYYIDPTASVSRKQTSCVSKQPAMFSFCFACCRTCAARITMTHLRGGDLQFLLTFRKANGNVSVSVAFVCFKCDHCKGKCSSLRGYNSHRAPSKEQSWNPMFWCKTPTEYYDNMFHHTWAMHCIM